MLIYYYFSSIIRNSTDMYMYLYNIIDAKLHNYMLVPLKFSLEICTMFGKCSHMENLCSNYLKLQTKDKFRNRTKGQSKQKQVTFKNSPDINKPFNKFTSMNQHCENNVNNIEHSFID